MKHIRTRIAPSPTGEDIHIGNLYTALMNYAWAKKNNGEFIVRIEDTDRERFVTGAEEKIIESLRNYGIVYDEGPETVGKYSPYRQSERLAVYHKFAEELVGLKKAYYCFCTKERLDGLRKEQMVQKKTPRYDKYCLNHIKNAKEKVESDEKFVIRLNVEPGDEISFEDVVRGKITFQSKEVDDQVLIKSDGFPTYHMAVVVDDHLMKITHIIRAEEWISSTPKHVLLYKSFGWELPVFAHLPILRNPDRSKLSKRKNPVWASWYLDEGYLKESVLNFLALMGWSHPEEKEIFSLQEFIELFDLKDLKAVGPIFDLQKLTWMNQQYIQNLSDEDLKKEIKSYSKSSLSIDDSTMDKVIPLVKTRMETLKEFKILTDPIFNAPNVSPRNESETSAADCLIKNIENIDSWNKDTIFSALKICMSEKSIRMPVYYYILTGNERGLPLPEVLEIIGKDEVRKRLKNFVK